MYFSHQDVRNSILRTLILFPSRCPFEVHSAISSQIFISCGGGVMSDEFVILLG
jgi:hypothetical protein